MSNPPKSNDSTPEPDVLDDTGGPERKEKVLHTRVSESLEQELKRRAQELGVSVSNLVRNVLSNTFDMVEEVVADTSELARAVGGVRPRTRSKPAAQPAPILGWQELTLNVNALCEECNAILPRGTRAAMALPVSPERPVFRCSECVPSAKES